ncbi:Similar to Tdpoz1: TD and POZ domain-containing protein 1 (Mus musculus) [Cotesia congregata]|uniref:Similar to Tdpoz1: TD and POZ domain-containing protein 1 (Mus musculus) n=1 Tax=Cotesia congregata TaxID=51543 RepID=A0A8J2H601_COTCN|nr:Similar to Tdpoz1: TD and POZ domain-containing protein 1 (Mus musculus) [Cotesia congregata]
MTQVGYTSVEKHEIIFEWRINEISLYLTNFDGHRKGDVILYSEEFSAGSKMKDNWKLQLKFNDSDSNENKDYVSLYLYLLSKKKVINANCTFFYLINNSYELNLRSYNKTFENSIGYGIRKFYSKKLLLKEKDRYIPNDTLVVGVKLIVFDRSTTIPKDLKNKPTHRLIDDLVNIYKNEKNTDIVLKVEDKSFKAHKTILKARCPVLLSELFAIGTKEEDEDEDSITIPDMNSNTFGNILEFIYSDRVEDLNDAENLLKSAVKYDLQGLKELCVQSLYRGLNVINAPRLLDLANKYNILELLEFVSDFIVLNAEKIINTSEYQAIEESKSSIGIILIKKIAAFKINGILKLNNSIKQEKDVMIHSVAAEHFPGAETDEDFIKAAFKMHFEKKKMNCQIMSLDKRVEAYNSAMTLALPGSESLAHAFANRSIVLSNAAVYEESLKDIDHALKANYPDNLKALLFARKAKNLLALDPTADIEQTLNEARQWALKMNDKEKNKLLDNLDKLKTKNYKKPVKERDGRIFVPSPPNGNTKIKDTSAAITINYSEKFGRHIVATRDMMAGEVISVKRAYALVLSSEYRFKLCWNCSKHCWSSVPCNTCSNVIYCSEECRNVAWKDYHDIECSILTGLLSSTHHYEDISLMSLRLFIKAIKEFGTVKALYESVQKIESTEQKVHTPNTNNEVLHCGGLLNPLESLYNHSCDPNTGIIVCLDMSAFITLQTIKKGEQLFISYG